MLTGEGPVLDRLEETILRDSESKAGLSSFLFRSCRHAPSERSPRPNLSRSGPTR